MPLAKLRSGDLTPRATNALLSSIDERAEHGLDHGFDGRIIDALGLRQFGRDGFEVAIAADGDSGTAAWRTIAS